MNLFAQSIRIVDKNTEGTAPCIDYYLKFIYISYSRYYRVAAVKVLYHANISDHLSDSFPDFSKACALALTMLNNDGKNESH